MTVQTNLSAARKLLKLSSELDNALRLFQKESEYIIYQEKRKIIPESDARRKLTLLYGCYELSVTEMQQQALETIKSAEEHSDQKKVTELTYKLKLMESNIKHGQ